jgi:hypothetical protein
MQFQKIKILKAAREAYRSSEGYLSRNRGINFLYDSKDKMLHKGSKIVLKLDYDS